MFWHYQTLSLINVFNFLIIFQKLHFFYLESLFNDFVDSVFSIDFLSWFCSQSSFLNSIFWPHHSENFWNWFTIILVSFELAFWVNFWAFTVVHDWAYWITCFHWFRILVSEPWFLRCWFGIFFIWSMS